MSAAPRDAKRPARVRRFPIRSAAALKEIALSYVARFPCTSERLKKHLATKMRDAVKAGEARSEDAAPWIDEVVKILVRVRLVDDRAWAEARAWTLHRRGRAERYIGRDLTRAGASEDDIANATQGIADEVLDPDMVAAARLAKKKKIGPWSPPERRLEHRQRHFALLARSGFSFSIARAVLDAKDVAVLEDLLV